MKYAEFLWMLNSERGVSISYAVSNGPPTVELRRLSKPPESLLSLITPEQAWAYRILPVLEFDGTVVFCSSPDVLARNYDLGWLISRTQEALSMTLSIVLADDEDTLEERLLDWYGPPAK